MLLDYTLNVQKMRLVIFFKPNFLKLTQIVLLPFFIKNMVPFIYFIHRTSRHITRRKKHYFHPQ